MGEWSGVGRGCGLLREVRFPARRRQACRLFQHGGGFLVHRGRWRGRGGLFDRRVRGLHAPLDDDIRQGLEALFEMRWPGVAPELDEEDRQTFDRLCRPGSPDFILDHPDYHAFFTYTMFWGTVPGVQ